MPPAVLAKPADGDCNLACEYCFYRDKPQLWPQSRRRMTIEVAEEMIKEEIRLGEESREYRPEEEERGLPYHV